MPGGGQTPLTAHQLAILDWIKQFIRTHAMPPTVREIGAAFDIKSSSVFALLKALERKGALQRGELGARSLIIHDARRRGRDGVVEVSIIGRIAAGRPIEAIEGDRGTVSVRRDLLRGQPGYALQVVGDSMIDAGILNGDYVVVRKQETADDGDIVVALIGDEATLKRIFRERDGVWLEPANRALRPIWVRNDDFRVQGKVVGVHRVMES
ncbi:MAG: LexA repressor [Phycisphaerae bacterium]|nr:LexA repressor [Phycisphaerae bacterium]